MFYIFDVSVCFLFCRLDKKEDELEDTSQPNKGKRLTKRDEEEDDDDEDFDDQGFSNDDCDSNSEVEGN